MIKIELTIETTQEKLKECIVIAMRKRFGKEDCIVSSQVRDFKINDNIIFADIQNILLDSCISELIDQETTQMKRIR